VRSCRARVPVGQRNRRTLSNRIQVLALDLQSRQIQPAPLEDAIAEMTRTNTLPNGKSAFGRTSGHRAAKQRRPGGLRRVLSGIAVAILPSGGACADRWPNDRRTPSTQWTTMIFGGSRSSIWMA